MARRGGGWRVAGAVSQSRCPCRPSRVTVSWRAVAPQRPAFIQSAVWQRDPRVAGDVQLCSFSRQLSTSALGDRTWEQMRQAVTHPRCPLKKGQRGGKVPQMGCEVYIHCPLFNRLRLMKCLMSGHISLIFGGSSSLHCQKTPPSGPLPHSGQQAQGGAQS